MIVHFVVPLLRALGWPVEWIAIKWRNIDVAVFHGLPQTAEKCRFVIEAKRFGQSSLETHIETPQASRPSIETFMRSEEHDRWGFSFGLRIRRATALRSRIMQWISWPMANAGRAGEAVLIPTSAPDNCDSRW
jgi:hypothetical protein